MSSSDITLDSVLPDTVVIFKHNEDSFKEPPMEEWSSLNFEPPEENIKRLLFEQGVYSPGSGEICSKYVTLSASSVLRHPYYKYPGITDPGIEEALFLPETKPIYLDDGQNLYIALCKEMGLSSIRSFHRQLLEEVINLRYYGIYPMGYRAIAKSLQNNRFVKVLDLTDNWISEDGCYHLGEMIVVNVNLEELNLHGCRIGPEGAKHLFANSHVNRTLRKINLTKNYMTDVGVEYLSKAIFLGSDLTDINLSFNDLTAKAVLTLAETFETHNKLTNLDLSWNKIFSPNAIFQLCARLSENKNLEEVNLSWNALSGPRIGNAIKKLMKAPNLKSIYLRNNKLSSTEVVTSFVQGLKASKNLTTLDLSYNPLLSNDALILLLSLKERKVKLQNLFLENVFVTTDFLQIKNEILSSKQRKSAVITWGGIIPKFTSTGTDMREIVLNRAEFLCTKSKKTVDIALIILELCKLNKAPMALKEFSRELKSYGVTIDEDLIEEITNSFPGPTTGKTKMVNLVDLADYIRRKWPDRKLPETPLPGATKKIEAQDTTK